MIELHDVRLWQLPSHQQTWKHTHPFCKTAFLLGREYVHFHDCWQEGNPFCDTKVSPTNNLPRDLISSTAGMVDLGPILLNFLFLGLGLQHSLYVFMGSSPLLPSWRLADRCWRPAPRQASRWRTSARPDSEPTPARTRCELIVRWLLPNFGRRKTSRPALGKQGWANQRCNQLNILKPTCFSQPPVGGGGARGATHIWHRRHTAPAQAVQRRAAATTGPEARRRHPHPQHRKLEPVEALG